MRTEADLPHKADFLVVRHRDRVLVENHDDGVIIRTSRDNFSPQEKAFFLRYLAAEGFVPGAYQWLAEAAPESSSSVEWLVDGEELPTAHPSKRAQRQILGLVGYAALVWMVLMVFAFAHARH